MTVKNRDIQMIMSIRPMMQQIVAIEQRKNWEKMRLGNITAHFSLLPGGNGTMRKMDDALANMEALAESHAEKVRHYVNLIRKAEMAIQNIPSVEGQSFVIMKYMDGKSDTDVRAALNMSRFSYENLRKRVEEAGRLADVKW